MAMIDAQALKGKQQRVFFTGLGKELVLKFNLNALYFLEKEYGDINVALDSIKGGNIESLLAITAAAINAGDKSQELTKEDVAEIVEFEDLEPLSAALQKLLGDGKAGDTPSAAQ